MENFPYLLTLFIVTALAAFIYAQKTRRDAEKAFHENKPSELRMAAERSPAAKVMAATLAERRGKLQSKS